MEINYRQKMEKHLKRKLKPSEIVHHKDGNDRNNKLANLQICTQSEHVMFHKELRKKKKPTEWKQELNDYKNN
jgi:hypothetical protein